MEIHAIDARNEGQGDENGRDDGQDLHHVVEPVAGFGLVQIVEGIGHILVGFRHFSDLDAVIGQVPEVDVGLGINQGVFRTDKPVDDLAHGIDGFADPDDLDLDVVQFFLGNDGIFLVQELIHIGKFFFYMIQGVVIVVYGEVENAVSEVIGFPLSHPSPFLEDPVADDL